MRPILSFGVLLLVLFACACGGAARLPRSAAGCCERVCYCSGIMSREGWEQVNADVIAHCARLGHTETTCDCGLALCQ